MNARSRRDAVTSHDDVTDMVISPDLRAPETLRRSPAWSYPGQTTSTRAYSLGQTTRASTSSPSGPTQAGATTVAGVGGFTAALLNLTDHTDAVTASSTAKMIGYPTGDLDLHGGHTGFRTILLTLATLALAVFIGMTPGSVIERRRRLAAGSAGAARPPSTAGKETEDR